MELTGFGGTQEVKFMIDEQEVKFIISNGDKADKPNLDYYVAPLWMRWAYWCVRDVGEQTGSSPIGWFPGTLAPLAKLSQLKSLNVSLTNLTG